MRTFRFFSFFLALASFCLHPVFTARADDKISEPATPVTNPARYFQARPLETEPEEESPKIEVVTEEVVRFNGAKYRVFRSKAGSVMVPYIDNFSEKSLESALCGQPSPQLERCSPDDKPCMDRNHDRLSDVTIVRAEKPLTDKTKIYLGVIQKTIKRTCGEVPGVAPLVPFAPALEIGAEYKDPHKRDSERYRIYNRNLQPSVNLGVDF